MEVQGLGHDNQFMEKLEPSCSELSMVAMRDGECYVTIDQL